MKYPLYSDMRLHIFPPTELLKAIQEILRAFSTDKKRHTILYAKLHWSQYISESFWVGFPDGTKKPYYLATPAFYVWAKNRIKSMIDGGAGDDVSRPLIESLKKLREAVEIVYDEDDRRLIKKLLSSSARPAAPLRPPRVPPFQDCFDLIPARKDGPAIVSADLGGEERVCGLPDDLIAGAAFVLLEKGFGLGSPEESAK